MLCPATFRRRAKPVFRMSKRSKYQLLPADKLSAAPGRSKSLFSHIDISGKSKFKKGGYARRKESQD
jgi:hypothetical protein